MKAVALGCEPEAFNPLRDALAAAGFDMLRTEQPHQFFRNLQLFSAALVVVQWPLRDVAAVSVVGRIRELFHAAAPIVAIGARDIAGDAVAALQAGADDFVSIETPADVLLARIRAVQRRYAGRGAAESFAVCQGAYAVDYAAQSVTLHGQAVALTPKEFDLFWVLVKNLDRLIPKVELMTCVWGQHVEIDSHTLPQHVHALRRKLHLEENGLRLAAVYGAGYRLERRAAAPPQHAPAHDIARRMSIAGSASVW